MNSPPKPLSIIKHSFSCKKRKSYLKLGHVEMVTSPENKPWGRPDAARRSTKPLSTQLLLSLLSHRQPWLPAPSDRLCGDEMPTSSSWTTGFLPLPLPPYFGECLLCPLSVTRFWHCLQNLVPGWCPRLGAPGTQCLPQWKHLLTCTPLCAWLSR